MEILFRHPSSPYRVKVLLRTGIKREGDIESVYRSHYGRNWALVSPSGARKDFKTSQLDHKKSREKITWIVTEA